MIFSKFKKAPSKIQVFVRHCHYSGASAHKRRSPGFSHEKCHENLMATADLSKVDFTFLLDTHFAKDEPHFIEKQTQFPVVKINAGCEGKSFLALLDYVIEKQYTNDTVLYFLEDDYLHREGWADILLEGFSLPQADYITLFDHRDKYFLEMYENLQARLFHTASTHWRTTPSTTNTYAMRMKSLKKHLEIHRRFSIDRQISSDHEKFLALGKLGAVLLSSIPGWSTHAEPEFSSPCHDWGSLFCTESVTL